MDLAQPFLRACMTEFCTWLEKQCEGELKDGDGGVRRVFVGKHVSGQYG